MTIHNRHNVIMVPNNLVWKMEIDYEAIVCIGYEDKAYLILFTY